MQVGTRVLVKGKPGMIALDNEDGTFNVEFDDGDEADAPAAQLELAIDQSLDDLRGHMSGWPRELASGIRVVDPFKLPPKPSPDWTRFVCFSDTHGMHDQIPTRHRPEADVLLHAGDLTNTGELEQIESLDAWLSNYPAAHKVIIAGNHDITLDEPYYTATGAARFAHTPPYDCGRARGLLRSCTYLEDTAVDVCGYRIYGSPYQPEFCDWAFNLPRGEPCRQRWAAIPFTGVDILMTHGPPHGFGDVVDVSKRAGCEDLRRAIDQRPSIAVVVAGHVHEGYGCRADGARLQVNASTCTHGYRPSNPPIVFDAPPPEQLRTAMAGFGEVS
jgi:predicted phosphodiesterase